MKVKPDSAPVFCVVQSQDLLGEGPCWSPDEGRLYWFDIEGRRLSWLEPATGASGDWSLPLRSSAAAVRASGGLVVATERGLGAFDTQTGQISFIEPMTFEPGFRSNEGQIDPQGRFWWSIMDENEGARPGAVLLSRPGYATVRVLEGISIANTLTGTPEGDRLYVADSKHGRLSIYGIDPVTGVLDPPRPFANTEGEPGAPDGSALDAEGYLWNAQWGAWRVVRYAPNGTVDRVVPVPVEQPSSCAFGGPDLATLYVTSARVGLSEAALAAQPMAGGLFAFDPGVKGQALPAYDG